MMRFLFILLLVLAGSIVIGAPARAEDTAEVVFDDGRPTERVPLLHYDGDDDVWFLRANDVARLFRATQFWNASSRKIVLGIGKTRFVLTVDTRVVVIDGEPFMMRSHVRYADGFVLVPLEFMLEIANEHTARRFTWDDRARRLDMQAESLNVTRISFDTGGARTTATLSLTEPLVYHVDTGTRGLVRLKIYGARADVRALTVREAHGLVRGVRAEQAERDAFVTFDVSSDAKTVRVDRTDSPPQIVVTLDRTASADADTGLVVLDEGAPVGRAGAIEKVCIDAGHGGRDLGHERGGVSEKDITLAIARAAAEQIQSELGLEVVMTRDDDRLVGLRERTEIANRSGADLFISIHCNSWFNARTGGFESYFFSPARSEPEVALARDENRGGVDFILWDLVQNAYISESSTLAETIQREMTSKLGIKSRGVKQANLVVLQGANMPAVLIETAFLSNPGEAKMLADPDFQKRVADGLVASIRRMQEQYR
ncbi:MAG TPA: N-acetylmuramoyl-L-alanine amidase [Candidatus Krumholzibacteria bacterium]